MGRHSQLVVTGGEGQLGRALRALLAADPPPPATFIDRAEVDLAQPHAVYRLLVDLDPQVIIHAGAYTAVDAAEADPEGARRVNVDGTRAVADAARSVGALLVYISTDYVFAGDSRQPYPEQHHAAPVSVYGATKLAGEQLVAQLGQHLIVRTSWVFGQGHNFVRSILRAAAERSELTVVDDQRGRPTYAPDLAAGILALLGLQARGTFHLQGGGEPAAWADVAEVAVATAGLDCTIRRISTRDYDAGRPGPVARRPAFSVLDCAKAAAMGVTLRPWRLALEEYVKVGA